MSAHDAWRRLCRAAKPHISAAVYRACFSGTSGSELTDDLLVVATPNATVCDQLTRRFATLLVGLTPRAFGKTLALRFISPAYDDASPHSEPLLESFATPTISGTTTFATPALKPHYVFDEFIVGDSNRFAYAAAQSVAASPGQAYNPLFIYGGVGLGKTHLLMAIGHEAIANGLRVCYVTAETFTNEIIDAIQRNTQEEFRTRYRAMDMLLVDDIQFIGGKERTEEEFFHTFNALHNANKQIVVTSDRPPRSIPTLHDRLRSRFEWGLLADVATPDLAHRQAIVRAKAATLDIAIPPAVLDYLARPEGASVRALEGALNHIMASARLHGGKITMALVAATMRDCFGEMDKLELSPMIVLDLVSSHYGVSPDGLLSKGRSRNLAWPRQVTMYLLREETENSLAQIGAALGGRDHTTVMHGCEHVADAIRRDETVQREITALRNALRVL